MSKLNPEAVFVLPQRMSVTLSGVKREPLPAQKINTAGKRPLTDAQLLRNHNHSE
jgi:hypothetical protein